MGKYGRFKFGSAWTEQVAGQDQSDDELSDLRRELTELKVALASRETALEKAAFDVQQARDQWQRELWSSEQAWKTEEAARLEAAEARWRAQFESALAEMTARCEAAELMLERTRQEARHEPLGDGGLAEHANRTIALQQFISTPETKSEDETRESKIVIRTNRAWAAQAIEHKRRAPRKYNRGIVVAASLGLSAAAAYIGIERFLHFGRW